jgi:hypothetical protein
MKRHTYTHIQRHIDTRTYHDLGVLRAEIADGFVDRCGAVVHCATTTAAATASAATASAATASAAKRGMTGRWPQTADRAKRATTHTHTHTHTHTVNVD